MSDIDKITQATTKKSSLAGDARISITVSKDGLTANAEFCHPENDGKEIDWNIVAAEVSKLGIKYGIDKTMIQTMIDQKAYGRPFVLAKGVPPTEGEDAKYEYSFDRKKTGLPKVLPDGRVDFRDLDRMTQIEADTLLLKMTPHKEGRPGISVFDNPILPKKVKPGRIVPGKNTKLSPDGLMLFSEIAGEVKEENGKVSVFNSTEISSDVGSATGNINFSGNIRIRGGVSTGYSVTSTNGNIEITGVVEGAYLEAGGNIILQAGMKGGEKGTIVARGDVASKFFENCNVRAAGNIRCEVLMNSDVSCGGVLDVSIGKGLIVGKAARAGKEILGKNVGSRVATPTYLEVGIDPAMLDRYKAANKELQEQTELLDKLNKTIDYLLKLKEAGNLPADKLAMFGSVLKSRKAADEKTFELNNEIESLSSLIENSKAGRIRVNGTVYPGVRLVIGRAMYNVLNDMQYCSFTYDNDEVKMGPY